MRLSPIFGSKEAKPREAKSSAIWSIAVDGAAISWHPSYMDLEGIISKRIGSRAHRLSLREWPERAWLKIKNPNFERRSAARANVH